jgi:hypothetical protein
MTIAFSWDVRENRIVFFVESLVKEEIFMGNFVVLMSIASNKKIENIAVQENMIHGDNIPIKKQVRTFIIMRVSIASPIWICLRHFFIMMLARANAALNVADLFLNQMKTVSKSMAHTHEAAKQARQNIFAMLTKFGLPAAGQSTSCLGLHQSKI